MKFFRNLVFILIALFTILILLNFKKVNRLYKVIHFFDKEVIVDNFFNCTESFPFHNVKKSSNPYKIPENNKIKLPHSFKVGNMSHLTKNYIDSMYVTGLCVAKNGNLVFENYYKGNKANNTHISWSVAKSFVSVMLGIAIEEGKIKSLDDKVTDYLPELKGSGYNNVKIVDVLQMSSGVAFNEDYGDFWSDINRLSRNFALGQSQDKFAASLKNGITPGTKYDYVSLDTHVLAMLIVKTTGKTLADYTEEKLWQPLGAEYDAQWIVDNNNMEIAFGGFNAALKDYLKFGLMILNYGEFNGNKIVSKQWILDSKNIEKNHLKMTDDAICGYGYQWWLPEANGYEMVARGHSGQFIYVNFKTNTVITQNSANYRNNDKSFLYSNFHAILAFLRSINDSLT